MLTNLLFYTEVGVTTSPITKLAFISIHVSSNRKLAFTSIHVSSNRKLAFTSVHVSSNKKLAFTSIFYYKVCIYGVFDFKVSAYKYLLLQR